MRGGRSGRDARVCVQVMDKPRNSFLLLPAEGRRAALSAS